jgi:hypothetical protein
MQMCLYLDEDALDSEDQQRRGKERLCPKSRLNDRGTEPVAVATG